MPAQRNYIYAVVSDETSQPFIAWPTTSNSFAGAFTCYRDAVRWRHANNYCWGRIVKLRIPNRRANRPPRTDWGRTNPAPTTEVP